MTKRGKFSDHQGKTNISNLDKSTSPGVDLFQHYERFPFDML